MSDSMQIVMCACIAVIALLWIHRKDIWKEKYSRNDENRDNKEDYNNSHNTAYYTGHINVNTGASKTREVNDVSEIKEERKIEEHSIELEKNRNETAVKVVEHSLELDQLKESEQKLVVETEIMNEDIEVDDITWQEANQRGLFFKTNGKRCIITSYRGNSHEVVIPNKIDGKPVIGIGKGAFKNADITKIHVPDSVLRIENEAFKNSKLVSFCFPKHIEYIGDEAFYDCSDLVEVTSDRKNMVLVRIGRNVFQNTRYVKSSEYVLLNNLFIRYNGQNAKEIDFPMVDRIVNNAFNFCHNWNFRYEGDDVETINLYQDRLFVDPYAFDDSCYLYHKIKKNTILKKFGLPLMKIKARVEITKPYVSFSYTYSEREIYVYDTVNAFRLTFSSGKNVEPDERLVLTLDLAKYLEVAKDIKDENEKVCFAYSYVSLETDAKLVEKYLDILKYDRRRTIRNLLHYQDTQILVDLIKWQIINKKNYDYALEKANQYGYEESVEFLKKMGNSI